MERNAGKGRQPRTLPEYIRWFAEVWNAETPEEIHAGGVWRDRVSGAEADRGLEPVGGSALGAPRLAEPFRRLIENSAFETEADLLDGHQLRQRHYARPARAALEHVGRRYPLASRWIAAIAAAAFDWRSVATQRGWTEEEAHDYLLTVFDRVWREFEVVPRTAT